MRPGIVGAERVWGGPVSATNSEAKREIRSMLAIAHKVIPPDELRTRRGVRIGFDTKLVNFRIDSNKLMWIDPIGIDIFDPQRAEAERSLPLDFTRFDAPSTTW
jgi:hypothetical protein